MNTILVVDDDLSLQSQICTVLYENGYNVLHANNGLQALELAEHQYIDLLITDLKMPQMNGYDLIKDLKQIHRTLPVLVISAEGSILVKGKIFQLGIDDYMVKPFQTEELLWRIEAILKRTAPVLAKVIHLGNTTLTFESLEVKDAHQVYNLSPREFYLLYKLASTPEKIFSRNQLLDEIWGFNSGSFAHTLDVHISKLRKKLKNNRDFSILTVRGIGYKLSLHI